VTGAGAAPGAPAGRLRVAGLTPERLRVQEGRVVGKIAEVLNALAERFDLVGAASVRIPAAARALLLARNVRWGRERWRVRTQVDPLAFWLRTRRAERYLASLAGRFDVSFQSSTLFGPGRRGRRPPYVVATDNTFALSERHWPRWTPASAARRAAFARLEAEVFRGAARVFTWSEFTRRSVIEDVGVAADRVVVTGAGTSLFTREVDPGKYATQTALFVGNEFDRKGGPVLLRAWEEVHRALPRARLLIAGPRTPEGAGGGGVHWLGRLPREELRRHLQAATVFVLPSLFEPYGIAFTEAKGHGLGCIGTDRCAMPEIIADGATGRIVPAGAAEPLARALVAVLGDPPYAERLGRASHAEFFRRHTWSSVVRIMAPHIEAAARQG
jgi:glycosyltransferase involved in cell wall biosynthesis